MKTTKEFFERLATDEAFAKDVEETIEAKRKAGASNYYDTLIPIASERGYELSREELDAINAAQAAELSDDELGKVAGGTSCLTALTVSLFCSSCVGLTYTMVKIEEAIEDA